MDNKVLTFIEKLKNSNEYPDIIEYYFRRGYCYYFAIMLQAAFNRGKVCWCCPLGHIVWVDDDGTPYDVEGINHSECEAYIPIEYIGDAINDFKHVEGIAYNISKKEIYDIYKKYCKKELNKDTDCSELDYYFLLAED